MLLVKKCRDFLELENLFSFSGYLYAYIAYLQEDCPACLLLLSTDRNAFFELSDAKQKIYEVIPLAGDSRVIGRSLKQCKFYRDIVSLWEIQK